MTQTTVKDVAVTKLEPPAAKKQRISTGILLIALGLFLGLLAFYARKTAAIALSDAMDAKQLPTLEIPSTITVSVCALVVLIAGITLIADLASQQLRSWLGALAGLGTAVGFIVWAAANSELPFRLSMQLGLTLELATPLFFGVLAGVLAERAGVVNIAIEGQFLIAAFAASLTYALTQSFVAALIAAALASVFLSLILAVFTLKYLVDHVVVGVVVNLLATGLAGFLYQQLVMPNASSWGAVVPMQPVAIPGLSELPFFGPIFFTLRPLAYLGFFSVALVWFLLFRTRWGLRVRAVGEHPHAADTVGINVIGVKVSAVLLGGVFAGLGGAYFSIGSVGAFQDKNPTAGYGFIALAAVIMGRWNPILGAIVALFFGFARALAQTTKLMQLPIPSGFIEMLPYLATIIAVAGLVGKVRAPAADGEHFVKSH